MNILIIGSGGREHALAWKCAQSPRVSKLYCAPGNAGIMQIADCVPLAVDDLAGLKSFAKDQGIDLTIVGPELPLSLGIADEFRRDKLKIFGPTRQAARIETSKAFAKDLMARCRIPTAASQTFEHVDAALRYLDTCSVPLVIKADGLAQGKGVIVASTRQEAEDAVRAMLDRRQFGEAGARIVIEDFLQGEELTMMAFADGRTVVPMIGAQDHKRIGEHDTGPNTGGMGAYAPAPLATDALREHVLHDILYPAVEGLSRMGSPYYGVLYAGLMVDNGRSAVLEFNARFGDPETQVVLPLLKTDLVDILEAVVEHRLDQIQIEWHPLTAVCVVLASEGYPGSYRTGIPITGLDRIDTDHVIVFHAGTRDDNGTVVTAGGRVLGVTGIGPDLHTARARAYDAAEMIAFDGRYFRRDIAARAIPTSV
ncbi:MAG: phosphoribosylamine--glycine ligase [Nitrospirae bacterium]|nr:MAG: phosphoribosylamine--glycine ligase [Nitrospirota bacterium]